MLNHCALQFLLYSIKLHSSVNTANGNTVCVCACACCFSCGHSIAYHAADTLPLVLDISGCVILLSISGPCLVILRAFSLKYPP